MPSKTMGEIAYEAWGCRGLEQQRPYERLAPWPQSAWEAAAQAVIAAFVALPKCRQCLGSGTVSHRYGTSYETDSADERALNWREVKCPECGGLGRDVNAAK